MLTIGILGSKQFIDIISKHYSNYPDITFISYLYQSPKDTESYIEKAYQETDFLLFSGIIAYYHARKQLQKYPLNSMYLSFRELVLSLSLFSIHYHHHSSLHSLSIDLPDKSVLDGLLKELQITDQPYVKDYAWIYELEQNRNGLDIESYIRFHVNLFHQKKTTFALTSIHAVYDQLQKHNIPSIYMMQPSALLKEELEKVVTLAKLEKAKDAQIAVISVHTSFPDTQKDNHSLQIAILQKLQKIGRKLNAHVSMEQMQPFLVYTNQGTLEQFQIENVIQELDSLTEGIDLKFEVGIGYGYTVQDAENHASQALSYAAKHASKHTITYLIDERKQLKGPLFQNEKSISLQNEDSNIQQLAAQCQISTKNLLRFIEFVRVHQFRSFTASALASYLNLSRRSAERLIKRLLEKNLLLVTGEEQPYEQGRPRALYNISEKFKQQITIKILH
jgi:predicted transcriptional regulator